MGPSLQQRLVKRPKHVWDERQPGVEAVIHGHLDGSLTRHGHTQADSLAGGMLLNSLKFTNHIFQYLSNTNRELTDCSGFPLPDAWLLSTEVITCCCKALNMAQSEVHDISIKSTPLQNMVCMLYAMLRAHNIMEEYLKLKIKNHPSISSE
jgi:hypothetical protein